MILAAALVLATQSVADMREHRRVLIVAASSNLDAARFVQMETLRVESHELAERDVTVVEVVGDQVTGARDAAAALRSRWKLSSSEFAVILIGKDGHEALRRASPIDAKALIAAIDAMPMRRVGLR